MIAQMCKICGKVPVLGTYCVSCQLSFDRLMAIAAAQRILDDMDAFGWADTGAIEDYMRFLGANDQ